MSPPDDGAPAPAGISARPRLHPGLGWWAVLLVGAAWVLDPFPGYFIPRPFDGIAAVVARFGYGMIAARAAVALLFRNRSWWWVTYAVLLIFLGFLVGTVLEAASDHWRL